MNKQNLVDVHVFPYGAWVDLLAKDIGSTVPPGYLEKHSAVSVSTVAVDRGPNPLSPSVLLIGDLIFDRPTLVRATHGSTILSVFEQRASGTFSGVVELLILIRPAA